jgi:hypothetical protein
MTKRLTRKQLPHYAKIKMRIDLERLRKYIIDNGYTDYSRFNDINISEESDSNQKGFVLANQFCRNNYFKEEGSPMLVGEAFKQLYLTSIPLEKMNTSRERLEETSNSIFSRQRRLKRDSDVYVNEADEYNYTERNEHYSGMLAEILDGFKSPKTRVRLAVIAPGFTIKPHFDYDPSYVTRYHIPIFTNPDVKFGAKTKNGDVEYHMAADGSVYFFNAGLVHWVHNGGTEPRLHLLIDTNGQDDLEILEDETEVIYQ